MKTLIGLCCTLLFVHTVFAQKKAIKITSETSKREIVIKENKRVKVRTLDGQKIKGRLKIVDSQTILVQDQEIDLANILQIKRNPLLLNLFTGGVLIYTGTIVAGFGAIIGIFIDSAGYWLIPPGLALIAGGTMTPNINKAYKKPKKWNFEIITLQE